jgi:hypothetical protein
MDYTIRNQFATIHLLPTCAVAGELNELWKSVREVYFRLANETWELVSLTYQDIRDLIHARNIYQGITDPNDYAVIGDEYLEGIAFQLAEYYLSRSLNSKENHALGGFGPLAIPPADQFEQLVLPQSAILLGRQDVQLPTSDSSRKIRCRIDGEGSDILRYRRGYAFLSRTTDEGWQLVFETYLPLLSGSL